MSKNILYSTIGYRKAKWVVVLVLGFLAFFMFFAQPRSFLFSLLNWNYSGIIGIPAKILALFLAIFAWDWWHT